MLVLTGETTNDAGASAALRREVGAVVASEHAEARRARVAIDASVEATLIVGLRMNFSRKKGKADQQCD